MCLVDNNLGGDLCEALPFLFAAAPQLDVLDLHNNAGITNSRPLSCAEFHRAPSLRVIDLSQNILKGDLQQIGTLPRLELLALFENLELRGAISQLLPPLSSLPSLKRLWLTNTAFSGDLTALGSLANLVDFKARKCRFVGPFPSLASVTELKHFDVEGNLLSSGDVGESIWFLSKLQYFSIKGNLRLSGLHPRLPSPSVLTDYRIDDNYFSGPFILGGPHPQLMVTLEQLLSSLAFALHA